MKRSRASIKRKIAVLEDDFAVLDAMGEFLANLGYEPILAGSIGELWRIAAKNPPDAYILDVNLGPGPENSGLRVLETLKRSQNPPPVIMFSGYGPGRKEEAEKLGADAFLPKSGNVAHDCVSIIERLLKFRSVGGRLLYQRRSDLDIASIRADIVVVNRDLLRYLSSNPAAFYSLDPRRFEEVIAEIWSRLGYQATLTPRTRDGGKDIYAVRHDSCGDLLYIIECKRYDKDYPVGVEVVRALYGVTEAERATMGLVVTTSYFTEPAHEFQRAVPFRLALQDFRRLAEWLRKCSPHRDP